MPNNCCSTMLSPRALAFRSPPWDQGPTTLPPPPAASQPPRPVSGQPASPRPDSSPWSSCSLPWVFLPTTSPSSLLSTGLCKWGSRCLPTPTLGGPSGGDREVVGHSGYPLTPAQRGPNLWGPTSKNDNMGFRVQKLRRLLRGREQSLSPSPGPSKHSPEPLHSHVPMKLALRHPLQHHQEGGGLGG